MAVRVTTIEHVAMRARPYPAEKLAGLETGLVLFAAAFEGHNDAIHFALAELETTCVDVDGDRLARMAQIYPRSWKWAVDDAFRYAEDARALGERWDAVSVDTFTGDTMARSLESLELWTAIANRLVTATITADAAGVAVPWLEGWVSSLYPRSTDVYWLVLERIDVVTYGGLEIPVDVVNAAVRRLERSDV